MRLLAGLLISLLAMAAPPGVSTSTAIYELGMRIAIDTPGRITAIRYWRLSDDAGPHVGHVWSSTGQELARVTFASETLSGWQQQALTTPLAVTPGTIAVSVNTKGGHFAMVLDGLAMPLKVGPLSSAANAGAYGPSGTYPSAASPNNYYRDIVFDLDDVGTITIVPDTVGGFVATLNGFTPGPYTLGVTMRSTSGVIATSSTPITMPMQSTGPQ